VPFPRAASRYRNVWQFELALAPGAQRPCLGFLRCGPGCVHIDVRGTANPYIHTPFLSPCSLSLAAIRATLGNFVNRLKLWLLIDFVLRQILQNCPGPQNRFHWLSNTHPQSLYSVLHVAFTDRNPNPPTARTSSSAAPSLSSSSLRQEISWLFFTNSCSTPYVADVRLVRP
jgi:hypothetical protein